MIDDSEKVRNLLHYFESRKEYAAARMSDLSGQIETCFALSGLTFKNGHYVFSEVGELRELLHPPGEIELAAALSNKSLLSAVARHMPSVTHELALRRSKPEFEQTDLTIGWWIISALRCRTLVDILIPAVASASWDILPAIEAGSCKVQLLEDVPAARQLGDRVEITLESLDWVQANLEKWINLLEQPAFRLAIDSLTTHHQHANLRMAAAALWAGFEALFGINSELRFRLALLAASYLEERGPGRLAIYRRIKKLYDYRSKAVHGGVISERLLTNHIIEVRELLSRLVCRMTEIGTMPTTDEYEELLLT